MSNQKTTNPIRVLHVLGTTNLGGAESRIMELYRCIDRRKVQFDFLVHTDKEGHYSKEIRELGGRIYSLPRFKVINYAEYKKAIKQFFQEHREFVAVQGHMTSTASIYLPIAKKANPSMVTIAHARSAGVDKGLKGYVTKCLRSSLKYKADYCFTCSKEAGIAVFGKKWVEQGKVWTIPNAIDVNRFQYNETVRNEIRAELGIQDKFVIGHVGRFGFMKNHSYLVDIFAELCRQREDMVLVLIGKGEEEENVHSKLKKLGVELFGDEQALESKVLFLGNKFDVERYYQAFDYFVFPSTFEGLPGSVAEAQAAGLHCLISDKITREVALTELVSYRSIEEEPKHWAEEILQNAEKALVRKDVREAIAQNGFDVNTQAVLMEEFYRTGQNPPGKLEQ